GDIMVKIGVPQAPVTTINTNNVWDRIVNLETNLTGKTSKEKFASSLQNSNGIINRMIEVGQTYLNHIDTLVYGNQYTAYDSSVQQVSGKNQIDCSSFTHLLVNGITYENSRYNGNSENIGDRLFFHDMNGYENRYANDIGKWCYDNEYTFIPLDDVSNLQPGDIVFFSWDAFNTTPENYTQDQINFHNEAFMKIDHVGIYLHQKNEGVHTLLELDNGFTTVYYDATPTYMTQAVLVARLPFPDVDLLFPDNNILIDGDIPKNVSNTSTVASYKLTKKLQKGRYYTFYINGNVTTDSCYFIIQANGQTIFSDFLRQLPYKGITAFRFSYLQDTQTDTITLSIGAPSGTPTNRSAVVTWCSLYEGYVRNKKYYNPPLNQGLVIDFPLDSALVSDIATGYAPFYKYLVDGNKILLSFSLTFNTTKTGGITLGTIPNPPKTTQRIPCNVVGSVNQAINAVLQVSSVGVVSLIFYDNTVQWKALFANGLIINI
ncbi:MAG TPA: hypothetical protein VNU45_09220, partial [Rummeliibacillus sp.]|nr:hypothetical protein [Rummeliibacillus sp.]